MRQAIDRVIQALANFNLHRRLAVGAEASTDILQGLLNETGSEAAFKDLVDGFYKFFHEGLGDDRAFLIGRVGMVPSDKAFDNLVNDLRTHYFHIDDGDGGPRAKQGREWISTRVAVPVAASSVWQECGREFMELAASAMEALASHALKVRRRDDLSEAWRQSASSAPGEMVDGVLQELGMAPRSSTRDVMVRLFKSSPARRWAPDNAARRQIAAAVCTGFDLRTLPLPYESVLDALGVLGSADARAVLLLAHSVHEAGIAEPKTFLTVTSDVWAAVVAASGAPK